MSINKEDLYKSIAIDETENLITNYYGGDKEDFKKDLKENAGYILSKSLDDKNEQFVLRILDKYLKSDKEFINGELRKVIDAERLFKLDSSAILILKDRLGENGLINACTAAVLASGKNELDGESEKKFRKIFGDKDNMIYDVNALLKVIDENAKSINNIKQLRVLDETFGKDFVNAALKGNKGNIENIIEKMMPKKNCEEGLNLLCERLGVDLIAQSLSEVAAKAIDANIDINEYKTRLKKVYKVMGKEFVIDALKLNIDYILSEVMKSSTDRDEKLNFLSERLGADFVSDAMKNCDKSITGATEQKSLIEKIEGLNSQAATEPIPLQDISMNSKTKE